MRSLFSWGVMAALLALPQVAPARSRLALKPTLPSSPEVVVTVSDADTHKPLAARVYLRRVGSIGKHGLLRRDLVGEAWTQRLSPGRYVVTAVHGPEFTADQREIELRVGATKVDLAVRRVIEPGAWISCDLHLHSSHSFDSRVSPDDRVRSLAAAGVTFAAPTEHNNVGTYDAALAARLGVLWSPAMEVTPSAPVIGHYTVLPYIADRLPTTTGVTPARLLAQLRADNPGSLIQINHPRLRGTMGLFNVLGLDVERGRALDRLPTEADTVEVLNGVDLASPAQAERTFREWLGLFEKGHRYWATAGSDMHHDHQPPPGFPRVYAQVGLDRSAPAVLKALRQGHSFVTTGPLVTLRQGDHGPGEELAVKDGKAQVRLQVEAPPWMQLDRVELWSGGRVVWSQELAARPARRGAPGTDADEERKEAVRFTGDITVDVPSDAHALVAVVRGSQPMSDTVPGLVAVPFAFTNPMTVAR